MPRTARVAPGGTIFHCLNRGNERAEIFADDGDYLAFERVLEASLAAVPVRLLGYCLMPNHWHLLVLPLNDGDLGAFMQRLTTTHVRRWRRHRHSDGLGHLYQGTYKSFPVQDDRHFLAVARYVERNALRAKLVTKAEQWRWSSVWRRENGSAVERSFLSEWPVPRPDNWLAHLNEPEEPDVVAQIAESIQRGRPFGNAQWQTETARRLLLEHTFRPRGRPRKPPAAL